MGFSAQLVKIKGLAKRTPVLMNAYLIYMLFRRMPINDIFDFEKITIFWKVAPYTMTNYCRLSQVYNLAKMFERQKINGAFAECGVWKGGCAGVMAYVSNKVKSSRKVWLFDSFEGLPEPDKKDGRSGKNVYENNEQAPIDDINFLFFSKLKLDRNNIHIEKGWFQNTLPALKEKIGDIAILRLDCDLYESNKCCLRHLYNSVIPGGFVIINTYDAWEGTKNAVDEFLLDNNIKTELRKIDYGGRYFQKP